MTPEEVKLLMHLYVFGPEKNKGNNCDYNGLLTSKLIYGVLDGKPCFSLTPKGIAHVQNLCALDFPVQIWVMPDEILR